MRKFVVISNVGGRRSEVGGGKRRRPAGCRPDTMTDVADYVFPPYFSTNIAADTQQHTTDMMTTSCRHENGGKKMYLSAADRRAADRAPAEGRQPLITRSPPRHHLNSSIQPYPPSISILQRLLETVDITTISPSFVLINRHRHSPTPARWYRPSNRSSARHNLSPFHSIPLKILWQLG